MKLLLDGDILVYRSCSAVEHESIFDDTHIIHSNFKDALAIFDEMLADLFEQAETDDCVIAFSDSTNWRKEIYPEYKAHRKFTRKPLAYQRLVDHVQQQFDCETMERLEADDVLGILQTRSDEPTCIWSLDKDLKQIPGLHLIDDEIVEITPAEAERFHHYQWLVGDTADGYPGCPGVGPEKAEGVLNDPREVISYEHTFKSGPRKGLRETRWKLGDPCVTDDAIIGQYEKAGISRAECEVQMYISKILQVQNYDPTTGEVMV